jgi:hypothetical protein
VVAGSAGGVLGNDLQAVSVGGQALLVWRDYGAGKTQTDLTVRAALADGGEILRLAGTPGTPWLRARGDGAVIMFLEGTRAQTMALATSGSCAATAPATGTAWTPPPAPTAGATAATPLTRAECERVVARLVALTASDPQGKARLDELRDGHNEIVGKCEQQLTRKHYDCLMTASSVSVFEHCADGN